MRAGDSVQSLWQRFPCCYMLITSSFPLHFVFFLPHPSIIALVLGSKEQ